MPVQEATRRDHRTVATAINPMTDGGLFASGQHGAMVNTFVRLADGDGVLASFAINGLVVARCW